MKSTNHTTGDGRSKPEHARPMSCRGSVMQMAIAAAVRQAAPATQQAGKRQSWRVQGVITGTQPACPTLEAVIDERIAAGADAESVMEIAYVIVANTRAKLITARPEYAEMCANIEEAFIREQAAQGSADVSQMKVLRGKCAAGLREAWRRLVRHRDALDIAIVSVERATAEREREHATVRASFGLAPRGRAS